MLREKLLQEITTLPIELQTQVFDYVAFLRQRYKILSKSNEADLFGQGFLRQPEADLSEDFWDLPRPNIAKEVILETIRAERDED